MLRVDSPAVRAFVHHERLRGLTPSSIDKRLRILQRAEDHLGRSLITATTEELYRFLDRPDLAPRTRYGMISHLAAFYRWAIVNGHLEHDPTVRLARPKLRAGIPRPIDTDDLAHALENADVLVHALISLAAYCGLRCGEIASLNGDDIVTRRGLESAVLLVHGKGGKERVVPLHPVPFDSLRRYGAPPRGPVFHNGTGRRREPWWVSSRIRNHLIDLGIPASAHRLRHWFASSVYETSGQDLRMVQDLLGHSSPTTTAIYTRWAQGRAVDAVHRLSAGPSVA